jgi:hypothetical protein
MSTIEGSRAQSAKQIVRLTDSGLLAAVWIGVRENGKRELYFNLCRQNRESGKPPFFTLRVSHLLFDVVPGLAKLCRAFSKVADVPVEDRKQLAELSLLLAQANEMFQIAHGEDEEGNGGGELVLDVS